METYTENESSLTMSLIYDMPKPLKILVVEDDQTQWPLWESVLKNTYPNSEIDWETHEARAEALLVHAFQSNKPYGLVISDVYLEGNGTGIDLWNRYGEAAKNFIFVSGMTMPKFSALMESMSNLHMAAPIYLQKPLSAKVCKEAVRTLRSAQL